MCIHLHKTLNKGKQKGHTDQRQAVVQDPDQGYYLVTLLDLPFSRMTVSAWLLHIWGILSGQQVRNDTGRIIWSIISGLL